MSRNLPGEAAGFERDARGAAVATGRRCFFLGSFSLNQEGRGGGQFSQCEAISQLRIHDNFVWMPIDLTDSNIVKLSVGRRIFRAVARLGRLLRLIARHRPTHALIFTSCYTWSLLEKGLLGLMLKLFRVHVVYSYRSRLQLPLARGVRLGLRLCDRAAARHVVQSSVAAHCLYAIGMRQDKCIVMRNVVRDFPQQDIPARTGAASASGLRLVFVGWLEPVKGLKHLFRAIAKLRETGLTVDLTICGIGTEEPLLRKLAQELGIDEGLDWRGWLAKADIAAALAAADALVLPSLSEGLPNAVLEAHAAGIPVIATDVGGVREIVEDGVTGCLCPPADSGALAHCIRRLAVEPDIRRKMGRAGRAKVLAEFGPEQARSALRQAFGIE